VTAFMLGGVPQQGCSRVPLQAESASESENIGKDAEKAPLVKVSNENVQTAASVLGGVLGLLVGGVWVGAALGAATAFLTRQEDNDITSTIKTVARTGLEAINSLGDLNEEYKVTDQVGSSLSDAVKTAKENPSTKDAATAVTDVIDKAVESVKKIDKEVDIKGTAGSVIASVGSVTEDIVDKVSELIKEYKITDTVGKKIEEVDKELKISEQVGKITGESKGESKPK